MRSSMACYCQRCMYVMYMSLHCEKTTSPPVPTSLHTHKWLLVAAVFNVVANFEKTVNGGFNGTTLFVELNRASHANDPIAFAP